MTDAAKAELDRLIMLLPGFDPHREADGYWFDYGAAQTALDFFPGCLTFVEGVKAGQPFILEDWQKAIIANIFGWRHEGKPTRRFEEALIYVARKNGKSPMGAGIALYVFLTEDEAGMQCYSVASETRQASIIFGHAKAMIDAKPELLEDLTLREYHIERKMDVGAPAFYRYVSGEAKSKHGTNPYLVVVDELHVCKYALIEAFETGQGGREQNLMLFFTTAAVLGESVCNDKYDYMCKVRDGIISDPTSLPAIWEISQEAIREDPDLWKKEKGWLLSNPNMGVSVRKDTIEKLCKQAQEQPIKENEFKRLRCNLQTETVAGMLSADNWRKGDGLLNIEEYAGMEAAGAAIDLGSTSDLTSLCLLFDHEEGGYAAFWWHWMPKGKALIREKEDHVPYFALARDGWITLTEGDEIEYAVIRKAISGGPDNTEKDSIADRFGILDMAVDRMFQGAQLCQDLAGDGMEVTQFGQGYLSMTSPTKAIIDLVPKGHIRHGNDPIARIAAANTMCKMDPAGNRKPDKSRSKDRKTGEVTSKIDPVVALIMALGQAAVRPQKGPSVYDERGMILL